MLSVTSLGLFLATVNTGTLLIALPDVERELGTSLLSLIWVILAYMVASTVLLLPAGRLGDQLGRRRLYVAGLALFTLASLGAGFADSGTALILWRIVQGVGGALVFANSGALVTDAFPREQLGLAMGTNTMVAAVGLVIGPVLGGLAGRVRLGLGLLVQRAHRHRRHGLGGARAEGADRRGDEPPRGARTTCSATPWRWRG